MRAGQVDVAVVGGGPAGWAAAAALGAAGLRAIVLSDDEGRWPNTYGVWLDEVAGRLRADELEGRWPRATVHSGAGTQVLARPYGRVHGEALRARLTKEAADAGVRSQPSRVVAATHDRGGTTLGTDAGEEVRARVVVDASGHRPALVRRPDDGEPAAQAAVGLRLALRRPPYPPGSLVLMDYRDDHLDACERRHDPTFCYAMDYGDGTWFVEETSLARRPPLPATVLADRLLRRLTHLGAEPAHATDLEGAETVWIPMGLPVPDRSQWIIGFGGAASMVHPATGYLLAATLATAPRLAAALASALAEPDAPADAVARAGWRAVWPPAARRRHALHRFGLEALLRLDAPQTKAFFAAFFALPESAWRGYLSQTAPPHEVLRTMGRVFVRTSPTVRRRLAATAVGGPGATVAAELWRHRGDRDERGGRRR